MPTTSDAGTALDELIREIRRAFHALATESDQLHGHLNVTAAERGVLETLVENGPLTVPAVARHKGVTRQHVQNLVNRLLDDGLLETDENPAHQRSLLIRPSEEGRTVFDEIRATEAERLRELAQPLVGAEIRRSTRLLRRLQGELKESRS